MRRVAIKNKLPAILLMIPPWHPVAQITPIGSLPPNILVIRVQDAYMYMVHRNSSGGWEYRESTDVVRVVATATTLIMSQSLPFPCYLNNIKALTRI